MGELILLRHGETAWSRDRRHTGRTDLPLTADGEVAAAALKPVLASFPIVAAFTSPLSRATRTAELAGLAAKPDQDLAEWDYGAYEGRTRADILRERPEWNLFRDGCPQGETAEQVGVRVDRVLSEIRGIDGDLALFAHGHVLRVLGARWLHQPPAFAERLALSTASVSVLGREHAADVIWLWNDVSHLSTD